MKEEILNKAKELKKYIDGCTGLLENQKESYEECFIIVNNNHGGKDHYGTIPRNVWNKMLEVLDTEYLKLVKEFEEL